MLLNNTSQSPACNSTNCWLTEYFSVCSGMYDGVMFYCCYCSVLCLFGFPACVTVLWEMFQRHRRGTPTTPNDVFMMNMTIMDLFFLCSIPLGICNFVTWHNLPFEWFTEFLFSWGISGRPLLMTCICLDCYLAVVHPITYRARKGLTSRVLVSIGVWSITVVYGTLFVTDESIFINPYTFIPFVIALPTIGFCDFFIVRALKSSDPAGRDLHPQKKKARQVIINSLVMTVISYLPPLVALSSYDKMPAKVFFCYVALPVFSISTTGTAIMPLLYLSNSGKLDFLNLWCCKTG